GGGGGYSGGGGAAGSSNWGAGGGGGSYNIGTSQTNYDGSNATYGNAGNGVVIITWAGGTQTFNKVHNTLQSFTVPAGVTSITIVAKGAMGGSSAVSGGYSHVGGKGAYMSGNFAVTAGEVLTILVGETPVSHSGTCGTPPCTTPTAFTVTGGGTYCSGGAGMAVGLDGSESGINYQLLLNGSNTGSPVAGTGSAISFGNQTSGGTYTVLATNTVGSCTNTMTGSVSVTVTPVNTITLTSGAGTNIKGVCYNTAITNITYSTTGATGASFSGLPAGISGNWASNVVTISGSSTVTGIANYTVTLTGGCGTVTATGTITVNPVATVNAISNQGVCKAGSTTAVNFSSPTAGGTIVYNWTNNTTSIGLASSGSGNISSFAATNNGSAPVTATITVTPAYTNAGVTCNGTPSNFTITVNPRATVDSITDQIYCDNSSTTAVNFSSPTTGGAIVYNWTNDASSIGLAASGTGNIASFTATNTTTAPVVATITVTPAYTNGGATCNGTSRTFTITVNPIPTVDQPSNQVVCNNAATTLVGFTGPVAGTAFNWTNNTTSIGLAASGTGNIASFTATNATNAPVTATITVTPVTTSGVTFSQAFVQATSSPAQCTAWNSFMSELTGSYRTMTVSSSLGGTHTLSDPATVQNIANALRTATAGSWSFGGHTYWVGTNCGPAGAVELSMDQGTCSCGSILSIRPCISNENWGGVSASTCDATNQVLTVVFTTGAEVTCTGPSKDFTITVNPIATVNAVSNQVVCNNASTTAVNFSSPTTGGTIVYNWTNNNTAIGLAASGSGDISSFTATNSGSAPIFATITVTPAYTNGGVTCNGTATSFTITVNPAATVNTVVIQDVCNNGSTTAINFSSPTAGGTIVYNWTNNNTSIGLAASGTGNIASFTATNSGTSPVVATITVTPSYSNGGATCNGTASSFTITVEPTPVVDQPANQVVCNSAATSAINFTGPVSGTTFSWTNNTTSIGLAASGTGNIASFTAINSGLAPVTATITVTPSTGDLGPYKHIEILNYVPPAAYCTGSSKTFTITVNPTATVTAVSDQLVCNNTATTAIQFSSSATGGTIVYNWIGSNSTIGLASSGTGDIASFTAINTGNVPMIDTITVTPSYTNAGVTCIGTPLLFTITVNPTPLVDQPTNQVVCNNSSTSAVNFTGTVSGSTFSWTNNTTSIGLGASGTGDIASFSATNSGNSPVTATITVTASKTNAVTPTFIECNIYTGDDRGGIAATRDYVYLNGDQYVGRFNHDLTNPIIVGSTKDALFSDLSGNGTVYSFASAGIIPNYISGGTFDQIWQLDANLATVGSPISLSSSIFLPSGSSIFSGRGYVIVHSSNNDHFYRVSLPGAVVTDLGASIMVGFQNYPNNTENWGHWGYSEFTGGNYSVVYRRAYPVHNIESYNINTGVNSVLNSYTNLSDMASIVISPWDSKLFVHWEGGTQWGGYDESIGFLPYQFSGTAITCTGPSKDFTITVNPTATVNAVVDQVLCNGSLTTAINFSSPTTGGTIVYNWTNTTSSIGLAASGSGNISAFTATNITGAPVTATITVTPEYTNAGVTCTGTAISFTITVNPVAVVNAVSDQVICNNTSTTAVNFSSPTVGGTIIYHWTNNNISIGLAASGTGNIASFTGTNATSAPVTAT
ncbi:MAG: hypothetical protein WCG68_04495, partial [Actinomycetes bacterium]